MFKDIILGLLTLGVYPIVKKGRKTKLEKRTIKYREDGTVRKDVTLNFETDEDEATKD